MPDHKEMGREPTDRERETVFAPHHSPDQQADGDPGNEPPRPRLVHDDEGERSAEDATADKKTTKK
jgi:hypothetical protein